MTGMQKAAGAAILAALMVLPPTAFAQDRNAEKEFSQSVIGQVREALPGAQVDPEPGEPLQLNVTGTERWEDASLNLHRTYQFCQTASETDCRAELARLIEVFVAAPPEYGPQNLRIVVRDAAYWEYITRSIQREDWPLHRRIGDDLYGIIAFDSPTAIALRPPSDIADLGMNPELAWDIALAQTLNAIGEIPVEDAAQVNESIWLLQYEEFGASVMLDTERWTAIAAVAGPGMLVAPTTDQDVIATSVEEIVVGDFAGFTELVRGMCEEASRCVTPNVYRYRDGFWVIATGPEY